MLELNTNSPTVSTFASTPQTTTASNTTTVLNSGNAALVLSAAPTIDSGDKNYAVSAASTCANGASVAAGASCSVVANFVPTTSGTLTGNITLTDNQLGYTLVTTTSNETAAFGTNGTQVINLTGIGGSAPGLIMQTITFPQPTTPVTFGSAPITLTATGGASGNPVTFSVLSGPATVSGTNGSTLTFTGAGTVVVAADQAGTTTYSSAAEVTRTIVVNPAAQTITFTPPASPVAFTTTPITLTATGGASGNAVTFSIVSGPGTISGSQLTLTGVGTVVIAANQASSTKLRRGNAGHAKRRRHPGLADHHLVPRRNRRSSSAATPSCSMRRAAAPVMRSSSASCPVRAR